MKSKSNCSLAAVYFVLLLFSPTVAFNQTRESERIKRLLKQAHPDTSRLLLEIQLAHTYLFYRPDSGISLCRLAIQDAQRLQFPKGEARALNELGVALRLFGELPIALRTQFRALEISKTNGNAQEEARSLAYIGTAYIQLKEFRKGLSYLRQALKIKERLESTTIFSLTSMGDAYEGMDRLDSAMFFQQQAYDMLKASPRGTLHSLVLTRLGIIQARLLNYNAALEYYQNALANASLTGDVLNSARIQFRTAKLFDELHQPDSSLRYAQLSYATGDRLSQKLIKLYASDLLVKLYQDNRNLDSAFRYLQITAAMKDSLYGQKKLQELQLLTFAEQQRQEQLLQERARAEDYVQRIALISALAVFLLIALLLWYNNRQQQRANLILNEKNSQIETQRKNLETTLTELRSTQTQLIQKEKIASLYQQQLRIQQVRNKIASELHDDIGSTLSSIHLFSEAAKNQINKDSLQALPMIKKIESSSHDMMQAMSEIVWSIQPSNDDSVNLIEKIQGFANELLSARNIAFRFEYPPHLISLPMSMETRRNIYLIFKEALNNIAKHSQATQVDVEVEQEEKILCIGIRDNGCGFDSANDSSGNGLLNLRRRAEEIGGCIQIKSSPGKGTSVYLRCALT